MTADSTRTLAERLAEHIEFRAVYDSLWDAGLSGTGRMGHAPAGLIEDLGLVILIAGLIILATVGGLVYAFWKAAS